MVRTMRKYKGKRGGWSLGTGAYDFAKSATIDPLNNVAASASSGISNIGSSISKERAAASADLTGAYNYVSGALGTGVEKVGVAGVKAGRLLNNLTLAPLGITHVKSLYDGGRKRRSTRRKKGGKKRRTHRR